MSDRAAAPQRPLAILAAFLLVLLFVFAASAVTAQADSYGELQSFGEGEIVTPEKAFGVDPETGNVFVVDQEGEHSFKILDFSASGGVYKKIASAVFTPHNPTKNEGQDEVEGVAIDPSLHRLYVLVVVKRPAEEEPDAGVAAAGSLYVYSTEPSGGALKPPTGIEKGLLVSETKFEALSTTFGVSLLEPSGIAVDPTTGDVIISGTVDRGKLSDPAKEEFAKETTAVIQRVHSNGELGARYIDSNGEKSYFEECGCTNSPIVSSTGHVYLIGKEDELAEFPTPASTKVPPETEPVIPVPKVKFDLNCELQCRFGSEVIPSLKEKLVEIEEFSSIGSDLTLAPDGTIWSWARVDDQLEGPGKGFFYTGALEFTPEFAERGWTGGQDPALAAGKCVIDELEQRPAVAAGKESGTLFVLDRNLAGNGEEKGPRVIEFGPNGSGCPHPIATLSAEAGGTVVKEGEAVPIADSVTLKSQLTEANALGVEWEFGDGAKETISAREEQAVQIQHTFAEAGVLTVKETIHTDDLAEPTIVQQMKIDIVGAPTVKTEEAVQVEGTSATLKGMVNPNGQTVTECKFEYGETESYGSVSEPCTPAPGSGEQLKEVAAHISGLKRHTLYHFRIVAANKAGSEQGHDRTLTTTTASASATTEAASSIGQSTATLNAKVNPGGTPVECKFEYGATASYGASAACAASPGSGESPVAVSASLSGLAAGAAYHYRIVVESLGVPVGFGEDRTFTTESNHAQEEEEEKLRKRQEEEAAAAAQKHQEEEAAANKRHEEEAAAARKRQEEEAAANKRHEEEVKSKTKPPTRVQLLAKALTACKKLPKHKRPKCEAAAHKKYGSTKKKKKKK